MNCKKLLAVILSLVMLIGIVPMAGLGMVASAETIPMTWKEK